HLVAEYRQVLSRRRRNPSRDTTKPLLNQLLQRPSCTIAGKHGQIMDMDTRIPVGIGTLVIVNVGKPLIARDCSGVLETAASQCAERSERSWRCIAVFRGPSPIA